MISILLFMSRSVCVNQHSCKNYAGKNLPGFRTDRCTSALTIIAGGPVHIVRAVKPVVPTPRKGRQQAAAP
jgi:hypothetical protein